MSLLRHTLKPGVGSSLPVRERGLRMPLAITLGVWAARKTARGLWWSLRHPTVVVTVAGIAGVWWVVHTLGRGPSALAFGGALIAVWAWAMADPSSFDRLVESPARSRWRRFWVYRREWQPAMVCSRLAMVHGQAEHLPSLLRVRSSVVVDEVRARMLPAQTVDDWQKAAARLAQTFGATSGRAFAVDERPHDVALRFPRTDPLEQPVPVPAQTQAAEVDLSAIPVGIRDDGQPLTLPLLYSHLLVGGETGSGKGSVLWSLLCGIAPAVRDGLAKLWVIDPKGGVELSAGQPLFDRFVHGGPEQAAELLELAVKGMRARADRMRQAGSRKMRPTAEDPLMVIVIDELAAVTAYVSDAKLRRRITDALSLLLSQGRAVGVAVVAATQDVRKETVGMRDLFPARVALRAAEAEQADMLLGRGARERGARTDRIPHNLPGVGYVVEDGSPEPVRVRFTYVRDEDIAAVVRRHGAMPSAVSMRSPTGANSRGAVADTTSEAVPG